MHAHLYIGFIQDFEKEVAKLAHTLNASVLDYSLSTIAEVRQLSTFLSINQDKPLVIKSTSIDKASPEAMNGFLKDLEEGGENITFALHADNEHMLLPTIRSRSMIHILPKSKSKESNSDIENFLTMSFSDKCIFVDKIKAREDALAFVEELIQVLHKIFLDTPTEKAAANIKIAVETRTRLKQNGNVFLQLSVLAMKIE
jgi:DNA polymerase III, delta subunit